MNEDFNSIISASTRKRFRETLTALRSGHCIPEPPEGYRAPSELLAEADGKPLLLGFSGGIDSSVLLFFTYFYASKQNLPLHLVHLHHGIRGEEADRDAAFAEEIAALYGLPITLVHKNVPEIAKERGESTETAAWHTRYEVFESVMHEKGIEILLTAHNADDQLETVLFHLLRGSGLSGLCGIPPVRPIESGCVVRPLLEVSRTEIERVVALYGIPYVVDSTNSDVSYTRNRLRKEIIPALREIAPTPEKSASRLTASLRRDKAYLESEASALLSLSETGDGLDRSRIASAPDPIALRALLRYWQSVVPSLDSYSSMHLDALLDFVKNGRNGTHLSLRQATASLENDRLVIRRGKPSHDRKVIPPFTRMLSNGENEIPELGIVLFLGTPEEAHTYLDGSCRVVPKNVQNIYNLSTQIVFSFDTIEKRMHTLPLSVRPRRAGDRILTRGMHRSLRTLCNEAHLSPEARERLAVITLGDEILWIPGLAVRDGLVPKPQEEHSVRVLLLLTKVPPDRD